MFKFRAFITAFLLLTALFSVQSNALGVTQDLNTAVSTHSLFANTNNLTKTLPITQPVSHTEHKKTQQAGFHTHQPRLTASNSLLFLHPLQSEPEYDVVFEFFAPPLGREIFLPPRALTPIQPWYTLISHSKKCRLSNWKDANLLYTATTTYHA